MATRKTSKASADAAGGSQFGRFATGEITTRRSKKLRCCGMPPTPRRKIAWKCCRFWLKRTSECITQCKRRRRSPQFSSAWSSLACRARLSAWWLARGRVRQKFCQALASLEMIRNLHREMKIPLEVLVLPAATKRKSKRAA